jgi:hypothetical protein
VQNANRAGGDTPEILDPPTRRPSAGVFMAIQAIRDPATIFETIYRKRLWEDK